MLGLPGVGGIPANLAEQPEWEPLEGDSKLVCSAGSIGHFFSCTLRPKLLRWLLGLALLPSLLPPKPFWLACHDFVLLSHVRAAGECWDCSMLGCLYHEN